MMNGTPSFFQKVYGNCFMKELMVGIIVFGVVAFPFLYRIESQRPHSDEALWINDGQYFKIFFIDRDFRNRKWQEFAAYNQPPYGKYLVGLAVYGFAPEYLSWLGSQKTINFFTDQEWIRKNSTSPPPQVLIAVRLMMAMFGIFTCLLVFWIGRKVFGWVPGILASCVLAYHPLMLLYCRRAMMEAPLLFFSTLNIVLLINLYESLVKQKGMRTILLSVAVGLNMAMAMGIKLGGVTTIVTFLGSFLLLIVSDGCRENCAKEASRIFRKKRGGWMITSCLIGSVVAWIMFVVGNPTLYAHPWFATLKMIQIRMLVIQSQQNLLGDAVHSLSQKFFLVTFHSLLARSELINLFGFYVRVHLDFILFLVGGGTLLGREIKEFTRNSRISTRSIIVLWTVITFAGTIAWLPLNWLRYYLPVMPCVALLIGYGLSEILMAAWFLWKHIQQDKIT